VDDEAFENQSDEEKKRRADFQYRSVMMPETVLQKLNVKNDAKLDKQVFDKLLAHAHQHADATPLEDEARAKELGAANCRQVVTLRHSEYNTVVISLRLVHGDVKAPTIQVFEFGKATDQIKKFLDYTDDITRLEAWARHVFNIRPSVKFNRPALKRIPLRPEGERIDVNSFSDAFYIVQQLMRGKPVDDIVPVGLSPTELRNIIGLTLIQDLMCFSTPEPAVEEAKAVTGATGADEAETDETEPEAEAAGETNDDEGDENENEKEDEDEDEPNQELEKEASDEEDEPVAEEHDENDEEMEARLNEQEDDE